MEKKTTDNVIQFPGRRKSEESSSSQPVQKAKVQMDRRLPVTNKTLLGSLIAVMIATGAVNRFAFETSVETLDLASLRAEEVSDPRVQRGLASIERFKFERDAKWEKDLAERLASPRIRELASPQIGRAPTMEEQLRSGILEEQHYTFTYGSNGRKIRGILLQGPEARPSYILDRIKFLNEFGPLFEDQFKAAEFRSVVNQGDHILESYTVYDQEGRAISSALFELDQHHRLISLKVEPQI